MQDIKSLDSVINLDISSHERLSRYRRFVYPVISRRSAGLSLGINLNPDKKCNFHCVYCQVDRKEKIRDMAVDFQQIRDELVEWLNGMKAEGGTYQGHRLKDISIAGDGEPTMVPELPELIREMIQLKQDFHLKDTKLVLFSNGIGLNRSDLQTVFPDFFQSDGEIWFKMDYWNEQSLKQINRTAATFDHLLSNLLLLSKQYPIVLQSCFFSWDGQPFSLEYYEKYVSLLKDLKRQGAQFKLIQAYTLARQPTDSRAVPWSNDEMDNLAQYLQEELIVPVETYYEKG